MTENESLVNSSYYCQVRDPGTLEWISVSLAISRGLYDANKDRYFNLKTGELLSTQQALAKDMVKLGNKVRYHHWSLLPSYLIC